MKLFFLLFLLVSIALVVAPYIFTNASFSDTAYSLNNIYFAQINTITPTVSQTNTPTPRISANHIVISEVQTSGNNSSQDFVELYNPTSDIINLNGWRIRKKTSTGTVSTLVSIGTGKSVPAHGFFLWSNNQNGFDTSVGADVSNTSTVSDNNSIELQDQNAATIDQLGWGTGVNQFLETSLFPTNPIANHSLERKALISSTNASMSTGGNDEFKGNGYDADNNTLDFIISIQAKPQNSSSTPESP